MFHSQGPHGGPGWLKEKAFGIMAALGLIRGIVKQKAIESARLGAMSLMAVSFMWLTFVFLYSGEETLQLINYVSSCFDPITE